MTVEIELKNDTKSRYIYDVKHEQKHDGFYIIQSKKDKYFFAIDQIKSVRIING